MNFPPLTTKDLNGDSWDLPNDFAHTYNLVFIAYLQRQQYDVNSWVPTAERLERQIPDFRYYEFPVVGRMGWLGRKQLDYWMRTGIQDYETRSRTLTLYIDRQKFCRDLGITTQDDITTLLLDRDGRVIWRTTGWYTLEKESALRQKLAESIATV